MSDVDRICREIVGRVDGAVGCGVVGLSSGTLLGYHSRNGGRASFDGLFASAAADVLSSPDLAGVLGLSHMWAAPGQPSAPDGVEIRITTALHDYLAKVLSEGDAAVVLVTERRSNVGSGWAQVKSRASELEALLRG
jgi:hypothetical protein